MLHELNFQNCEHSQDPLLSCALEGVASIIAGIENVGIVIHSPQGCSATVASAYDIHEIDFTKRKIGCSRLFESDIIMGATDKLKRLILQADQAYQTQVLFIVGTCAADIIGEDLGAICRAMQSKVKAKLIPVMAGGFRGNSYEGMNLGLDVLLPLIHTEQTTSPSPQEVHSKSLNILAPQANLNPTWWADAEWVESIIQQLGGNVSCFLPKKISLAQLQQCSSADANILLTHDIGNSFAQKMEAQCNIPLWLNDLPLPIGIENTARWLRHLGRYLHAEAKAEEIIKAGEKKVVEILRKRGLMIIPRYRNCRIAISADCTLGIPLVRTLFKEFEMIPELLLFRGDSPQARSILEQELNDLGIHPQVVFSSDGWKIKFALQSVQVDAILGSSWEKYIAEELGIQFAFDVLSPTNRDVYVDRPYFGYDGLLNLLEVIANDWVVALRSKQIVWEQFV